MEDKSIDKTVDKAPAKKPLDQKKSGHPIAVFFCFLAVLFLVCCIMAGISLDAEREQYQKGLDEGYSSGYDTGYIEGYEAGASYGKQTGQTEGYEEGHEAGYDEGYTAGYNDAIDYANEWINNHYGDGKDEYYSQTVYVTDTGDCYHEEWCSYLKSKHPVTLQQAINQGYRPCSYCNPPD